MSTTKYIDVDRSLDKLDETTIEPENIQSLHDFIDHCAAEGISEVQQDRLLWSWKTLLLKFAPDEFTMRGANESELKRLLAAVNRSDYADSTKVIYDLQMINEEADNSIGLLMVSNQHPNRIPLDPRSQSRLSCKTLEFHSYNAPQLENILQDRVKKAFRPGTVPEEVIEKIAETVAENSGDCRKALSL
ncbi:MAG: hypothetical protein R6V35_04500, partial [Candidatus Nanohaloarchaea archaeon]